jgi:hypothetical protein
MSLWTTQAKSKADGFASLFGDFRNRILNIDPVFFVQNNLTLDGRPFRLEGNGYKPFADIYRYIGLKAVQPTAKPIVLVKGRQVGATTMAAALECYFMACGMYGNNGRSPMRIMHLFPTLSLAAAYTKDKLDPMIGSAKPVPHTRKSNGMNKSFMENVQDVSSPANNNMHFKRFLDDNRVWIESTGLTGDRIRGFTVDCCLFDEVQDMAQQAIGAVTKVLTQSKYGFRGEGVQVYFGTPKQKGTAYWKMWQHSSQQYYHLKCENCGDYFPLYRPDVDWEKIWLYGFTVKCTHCGHEQDKREAAEHGKWIAMNPDDDTDFVGYHINQLYIPFFAKETILKAKPENSPTNTERLYMNEVLGEFYDGEGGTVSVEEIHTKCADQGRKIPQSLSSTLQRRVYAGFDWGQRANLDQMIGNRQGRSYSCAVILTADGPRLFSVQFATRLMRNDPQTKKDIVEEMFRRYGVHRAVGDIGDAFDLTHELQKIYPERFLASRAMPKLKKHVDYKHQQFPKEIQFEKDYYISEVIGLLKEGAIRFPYGSYDRIEWLVNHCCSMEVKVTLDRHGDPIRRYVKGATPNDGFMALLNAYLAWKFDVTQGFQIKQPSMMKYDVATNKKSVPAVTGYLPRFTML